VDACVCVCIVPGVSNKQKDSGATGVHVDSCTSSSSEWTSESGNLMCSKFGNCAVHLLVAKPAS
jgi:hypothetical protein